MPTTRTTLPMSAREFKEQIANNYGATVPLNENDFISVTVRGRQFDCRVIRLLESDSDAHELIAEYRAHSYTELVRLAKEAIKEYRGAVVRYA